MEVKGEYAGVTVVDDFGKHPENIGQTLKAARSRFPNRRIIAVVEPKTATMCHKDMQQRLVEALTVADVTFFCPLERPERFGKDTIVPEEICSALRAQKRIAIVPPTLTGLAEQVASEARAGDVIIGFSSGDIGGFYELIGPALTRKIR